MPRQFGPGALAGAAGGNRTCSDAYYDTIFHHAQITPDAKTPRPGAFVGGCDMTANLRDVASYRAQLWTAGFRPVAVYNADAGVIGAGKRPRGGSWQHRARRDPPAVTERPERVSLNTGILCDALRAIDLDIDRPAVAAEVREVAERMLGPTPVRSRSNSSRCLLPYRAAEGPPGKIVIKGHPRQDRDTGAGPTVRHTGHPPQRIGLHLVAGGAWHRRPRQPASGF
jgi:hypothetical protein